jgi:hypothetical protein
MGVVNTTYTFTSTDTITSAKMNNIIDDTTFTSDAIQGTTLQVVSPGKLAVNALGITSNELASNAVVTAKIADSNVTTAKIANGAVITEKISDLAVTTIKLENSTSSATGVTTAKIADSNVTTAKIADANITAAKLSGAQTGTAPIFGVRAWVRFNGNKNSSGVTDASNTARQILGSGNVTSVTKISSGRYTVDFEVDLPSDNYTMTGHRAYEAGDAQGVVLQSDPSNPQTAGSFTFYALGAASAGTANSNDVQVMFIG